MEHMPSFTYAKLWLLIILGGAWSVSMLCVLLLIFRSGELNKRDDESEIDL